MNQFGNLSNKLFFLVEEDNEDNETMRLERKRQQLQRELSRLEAEDDSDRPTGTDKPACSSY